MCVWSENISKTRSSSGLWFCREMGTGILCGFLLSLLIVSKLPFELRPVCCCLLVAGITDAGHYNCLKIYYFMAKSVFHPKKKFVEKWELTFLQVVHFHHLFWSSVMTGRIEVINSFHRWQSQSLMWVGRKWQSQDLNPDSLAFAPSPQSIQQLREVLQGAHWYDHYCYFCFSLSSSFLHQFCYHCLLFNIQYKNIQCQLMFLYSNRLHIYLWVSLHDPCSLDSSEG